MVKMKRIKALEQSFKAINPVNECLLEFKAKDLLTELEALRLKGITPGFHRFYAETTITPEQVAHRRKIRAKYPADKQPVISFEELYCD